MKTPTLRPVVALLLAAGTGWAAAQGAAAPEPAASAVERLTQRKDTLWAIAGTLMPGGGPLSRAQVMVAILRANPEAFVDGNMHRLRKDVVLRLPTPQAMQAEAAGPAAALVDAHLAALEQGRAVAPLPPAVAAPPATAAAAPLPVPPAPAPVPPAPVPPAPVPVPPAPAPLVAAPASAPASVSTSAAASAPAAVEAPVPAPAAAPVAPPASEAAASPAAPVEAPGATRWLPYALAVVLVAAAAGLWWQRRRAPAEPLPSTFVDEQGVTRRRRPKTLDVSNAAAEMARTVETLEPAVALVSGGAVAPLAEAAADAAPSREQVALKLDLARALMEIGRGDAARPWLAAVAREGSLEQQADAVELAARLG